MSVLRRLYAPEYMVKPSLRLGALPTTRETYRTTFAIAWASIIESFLLALVSIADTIMVSAVGDTAIAAVGLVTQPRFIVQTTVLSLNIAVTSIAARRKGENNLEGATACLKQGLVLCIAISLLLSALALPFTRQMLLFCGAQADTIGMSKEYLDILLVGIPLVNISLTISAAQRGIGRTRISMQINMTANLINLVLNYLLIGGRMGFPRLGVRGAALATVISWGCGLVLAIFSVTHRDRELHILSRGGWRLERQNLRSMYAVGSGAFLEQMCLRAGFLTYAKLVAGLGTVLFAAHQILINIMSLSFAFGEGLGIAASALVGQNMGAGRPDLSIVYGKACQRLSFISSGSVAIILLLWGGQLIRLFTRDPVILEVGAVLMLLMVVIVFGQSSQMIFMGALRGAGDTRYSAVVGLLCVMLLRPVAAWIMAYQLGWGLVGAWLGFVLDQYLRMYLTLRRFSSGKWMGIKI